MKDIITTPGLLSFRTITNGCTVIQDQVADAFDQWERDDVDDLAATARQIARDAETLAKQADAFEKATAALAANAE